HVIFTDLRNTAVALSAACQLARGLGARITILAAQVVPYPLPIGEPPVTIERTEQMLGSLAESQDVETSVQALLCRDREIAIRQAVKQDSRVVVGARKRWWHAWERGLAKVLRRDGLRVLLVTE